MCSVRALLFCAYHIIGHAVHRLRVHVYFAPVSAAQVAVKTDAPAALRAAVVVAWCHEKGKNSAAHSTLKAS